MAYVESLESKGNSLQSMINFLKNNPYKFDANICDNFLKKHELHRDFTKITDNILSDFREQMDITNTETFTNQSQISEVSHRSMVKRSKSRSRQSSIKGSKFNSRIGISRLNQDDLDDDESSISYVNKPSKMFPSKERMDLFDLELDQKEKVLIKRRLSIRESNNSSKIKGLQEFQEMVLTRITDYSLNEVKSKLITIDPKMVARGRFMAQKRIFVKPYSKSLSKLSKSTKKPIIGLKVLKTREIDPISMLFINELPKMMPSKAYRIQK